MFDRRTIPMEQYVSFCRQIGEDPEDNILVVGRHTETGQLLHNEGVGGHPALAVWQGMGGMMACFMEEGFPEDFAEIMPTKLRDVVEWDEAVLTMKDSTITTTKIGGDENTSIFITSEANGCGDPECPGCGGDGHLLYQDSDYNKQKELLKATGGWFNILGEA